MSKNNNEVRPLRYTVKGQIQQVVIIVVTISLLLVGGVSCLLNYSATIANAETALVRTARLAADGLQDKYVALMNVVEVMGTMESLSNDKTPLEEKRKILDANMEAYNFRSSRIMNTKGISIFDSEKDLSARDYFKTAMTGKVAISDPIFSSTNGELIITIAAPVWKDGIRNSEIVGVVMITQDAKGLGSLVSDIKISPNGSAFMINSAGTIIAHENFENVENGKNTIAMSKDDPTLAESAAIEQKMVNGESGIGYQRFGHVKKIMAYVPVNGLNGWSLGVFAPLSDFTYGATQCLVITIVLLLVTLLVTIFVIYRLARGIGIPVQQCANRISLLVEGDLHTNLPETQCKNEIGILVHATQSHLDSLNVILKDLDYCLEEISNGNFSISSKVPKSYIGDFKKVSVSVEGICKRLNETLTQIDQVAEQVSGGSEQVSRDAQNLSYGALKQATSVTELFETINDTAAKIKANSQNAISAKELSDVSGRNVENSNRQMQELVSAMHQIHEKSNQIGKIIKTIDDIAFQTNILALNAAVEAARAGTSGKGFAVVADEVRNLAGKSAEAAKNTAALIEESIGAVKNGTLIADATAKSMFTVVEGVRSVTSLIDQISIASNEQSSAINQIINGVEQISAVVQTNSATAQESAAASEELSSQAQTLKSLVRKFQLK